MVLKNFVRLCHEYTVIHFLQHERVTDSSTTISIEWPVHFMGNLHFQHLFLGLQLTGWKDFLQYLRRGEIWRCWQPALLLFWLFSTSFSNWLQILDCLYLEPYPNWASAKMAHRQSSDSFRRLWTTPFSQRYKLSILNWKKYLSFLSSSTNFTRSLDDRKQKKLHVSFSSVF